MCTVYIYMFQKINSDCLLVGRGSIDRFEIEMKVA